MVGHPMKFIWNNTNLQKVSLHTLYKWYLRKSLDAFISSIRDDYFTNFHVPTEKELDRSAYTTLAYQVYYIIS